jgi:hypothetical protein
MCVKRPSDLYPLDYQFSLELRHRCQDVDLKFGAGIRICRVDALAWTDQGHFMRMQLRGSLHRLTSQLSPR